ncbi:MAG: L-piperidine-6-carboxylate dehydrogenase [Planctomycetota bacterium]|jgi:aldehyde dehydrogenase (NAD+)
MHKYQSILAELGIQDENPGAWIGRSLDPESNAPVIESWCPHDGDLLGQVSCASADQYEQVIAAANHAFASWRMVPAPQRGEIVRQIGDALRAKKEALGDLVTLEMGKIRAEGHGEVQEMIDICDFAVGLSRQLYGLTMHSERPQHRMYEQWHPLGIVGVISAFNFPVAVWAWNAAIAWVCGNVCVWKPSEKTPLTAIACQNIVQDVFARNGFESGISSVVIGDVETIGERLAADRRVPLVSATGSTAMGRRVGEVVAKRLGKTILELGGNNAVIVTENADLDLALRAIAFGALGTAGQRCTTTRRVLAQASIYDELKEKLCRVWETAAIGNPLEEGTLVGPLIDEGAVENVHDAIQLVRAQGGTILCGGEPMRGCYMKPALAEVDPSLAMVKEETFGPLLYLMRYETLDEAIAMHNDVPQGLSSAIFTRDVIEAETFLSHCGSDCGIANVNIGTSGAEIGGAFGGEKDTGGGRESGSDAWKAYMRRQTNTLNWSPDLPLAQGISFDL